MKPAHEREQLIKDINVLLNQAYDSILDEIYALLQKIEDEEEKEDLKAYELAKKDADGSVSWEEACPCAVFFFKTSITFPNSSVIQNSIGSPETR